MRQIYKKMYQNAQLSAILAGYQPKEIFVVADSKVDVELPYPTIRIEASESNKSLSSAEQIWRFLAEYHATRQAVLINIGGGVICDLGGFAAATYMRGIDYINIPTTLLAMVDAAVGGKTAVNLETENEEPETLLKNYVGAFRMPKATIIDTSFLQTLPPEELLSGFGEVLKTALLSSPDMFIRAQKILADFSDHYGTSTGLPRALQSPDFVSLINECIAYKQSIVTKDPEESGLRKVLNFGHTVGHAIEENQIVNRQSSNRQSPHGYCVVWGIVAELYLSVVLCGCSRATLTLVSHLMIEYFGRPQCNCKQQAELINLMRQDKKNSSSNDINFTLLRNVGDPIINQVADESLINEALDYLFSL